MSYPIDITIPDAPNDPADDQPLMKQNFININSYLQVDHIAAGAPGNGFHKEVTFYNKNPAALPVDPTSVLYTADGTASTVADMRFRNANGIFPVNAIRACVQFVGDSASIAGAALPTTNNINVDKVERVVSDLYKITLTSGATTGTNFMVFILKNATSATSSYTIAANSITSITVATGVTCNVLVVQI